MGHKHDISERVRNYILPKIGAFFQFLNDITGSDLYATSESRRRQFVARVDMGEEEFEKVLHRMGFERNPLASLKSVVDTSETEEGSFRKIYPEEHPEWQLHAILYDGSNVQNANTGETFIYAHWEYRWDVYPWKHYRGHKFNADKGVRRMRKYLNEEGIDYELTQP